MCEAAGKTSGRLLFRWIPVWKHTFSTLSNAACVAPFVVFINQSDANVCKNESPVSVHPPLLFGTTMFSARPRFHAAPREQRKGENLFS